jgi:O-acetyl-ADP-ribose deacetylase (regulator of RNase III)
MIRIILGDITDLTDVDVIVNSAKKTLLGGGGVDGAIHSKAGGELMNACRQLHGCETGEAKITKGYDLPVPYIIHTVGPIHHSEDWAKANNYDQAQLLKNSYLSSLSLAKEYNLKRIAFSAIATGAFGYPIKEATKIALDTVTEFLELNPEFEITFVLFSEGFYDEYIEQIQNYENIDYVSEKFEIKDVPILCMEEIAGNLNQYNGITSDDKSEINNKNDTSNENEENENIFIRILKKILM